jgi:hypothetical protein
MQFYKTEAFYERFMPSKLKIILTVTPKTPNHLEFCYMTSSDRNNGNVFERKKLNYFYEALKEK